MNCESLNAKKWYERMKYLIELDRVSFKVWFTLI